MAGTFLAGLKRLFFDRIFERSYWTWRKHPVVIIPTMLGAALSLIEQSIVVLVVMSLLTSWALQGSLTGFLNAYLNRGLLNVISDPEFSLSLILAFVAIGVLLIFVALVGGGYVYSSEYGIYVEAWNSESVPVSSVLTNGARRWKAMAWTLFLSNLITWGPAALGFILLLVSAAGSTSPAGLAASLVSLSLFQPLVLGSLIISVFTVYSYPAVIIDGVSGLGAVRRSFSIAGHNLGTTLTYCTVRAILLLPTYLIRYLPGTFAAPLGIPLTSLVTVVLGFALTPILHMTKAMIFSYGSPAVPEMPFQLSPPIWSDVFRQLPRAGWNKIMMGLSEIARYILGPRNTPYHLASAGAFLFGILLGYYVSTNGVADYFLALGYQPGHGNPLLNRVIQPALGVDIFLNNWYVSIGTALAGLGFAAPSFVTIMFNGFILGILAVPALSPSLTMFLAAILPHGIIEIPSFVLSGSVGLRLGYAALKSKFHRGPEAEEYLSRTFRSAVYVVVGLAPIFLIAGLIEADITPYIMRMFGWVF